MQNNSFDKGWVARENNIPFDPYQDEEWISGWKGSDFFYSDKPLQQLSKVAEKQKVNKSTQFINEIEHKSIRQVFCKLIKSCFNYLADKIDQEINQRVVAVCKIPENISCPNCGEKVVQKYCSRCGKNVEKEILKVARKTVEYCLDQTLLERKLVANHIDEEIEQYKQEQSKQIVAKFENLNRYYTKQLILKKKEIENNNVLNTSLPKLSFNCSLESSKFLSS